MAEDLRCTVDAETLLSVAPGIYQRAIAQKPGQMARSRPWWDSWIHDNDARQKDSGKIGFASPSTAPPSTNHCATW